MHSILHLNFRNKKYIYVQKKVDISWEKVITNFLASIFLGRTLKYIQENLYSWNVFNFNRRSFMDNILYFLSKDTISKPFVFCHTLVNRDIQYISHQTFLYILYLEAAIFFQEYFKNNIFISQIIMCATLLKLIYFLYPKHFQKLDPCTIRSLRFLFKH